MSGLRVEAREADALSRCTGCHNCWLRSAQRRWHGGLFRCIAQTWFDSKNKSIRLISNIKQRIRVRNRIWTKLDARQRLINANGKWGRILLMKADGKMSTWRWILFGA